jgi:2-alkenal reductase
MSTGIISGLGRLLADGGATASGQSYSIPDIVQTDAAINPGNSGGPLLDLAGNVVGVNTAIESAVRSNSGVGYAVPADLVARVVPSLISTGKFEVSYLGISGGTLGADLAKAMGLDPQQRGVLVAEVTAGGPAAKAGLLGSTKDSTIDGIPVQIGGDVIVAVDGVPVKKFDDLLSYLVRHTSAGDQVTLSILRDGKPMDIKVTLGVRPAA